MFSRTVAGQARCVGPNSVSHSLCDSGCKVMLDAHAYGPHLLIGMRHPSHDSFRSSYRMFQYHMPVATRFVSSFYVHLRMTYYVGLLISLWLLLFAAHSKEFFLDGLKKLEQRSHKRLEFRGEYVNTFFFSIP
jgi:hypothetical protein